MQTFIVVLILIAAVGYAVRRVWLLLRRRNSPCHGCEGCALREEMMRRRSVQCPSNGVERRTKMNEKRHGKAQNVAK
ncbi:MAG: FeoB-associated Cys-rich membrane protein [Prevotella sp.]|nr:FeoB-associated Cys-rich membrane protein [Prevotella sp.]